MIKRTQTAILAFIIGVISSIAQTASVGDWKIYTSFDGVDRIVATPEKYYYLSDGSLFSYDYKQDETYAYTTQNKLNDTEIDNIFYNPANRYLAVTYMNGNIDLLYDNGKTVSMSDIRDAIMSTSKRINYITFGQNRIYVATEFGIVIFDDQRHCVVESGIYNTPVKVFTRLGDYYLIGCNDRFRYMKADRRINSLNNFKEIFYSINLAIQPVGDNALIASAQLKFYDSVIRLYKFDFENGTADFTIVQDNFEAYYIDPADNGYCISGTDRVMLLDKEGKPTLNTPFSHYPAAIWKESDGMMAACNNGIAKFAYENGTWQQEGESFTPGTINLKSVDMLRFDNWGNLYMTGITDSRYLDTGSTARTPINRLNADGTIEDLEPVNLTFPIQINVSVPDDKKLWNNTSLTPHPSLQGQFYVSNYFQGLSIHHDNEILETYIDINSPIEKWWGCTAMGTTFDDKGNLWALINYDKDPSLYFIPADKTSGPTKEDWVPVSLKGFKTEKDARILYGKKSKAIIITTSRYDSPVVVYDTKGTESLNDDTFSVIGRFVDQDGRDFFSNRHPAMFEDENGHIWLGTSDGVIIINNPKALAANPQTPVTRVKVSRNDGTNLADYLLSGETVLAIDADNANRKWIATKENGVYLVSDDGTKIIDHFTTDNSPLPSNSVHSIACDPESNSIYFGTPAGLAQYSSTASPARADFSEVVAYPNPVRPDFTGWITIKGLMENSLVKIADAAGNVIFTTRSEGGMAMWDGCNSAGQRAKTGVYYVFASSGSESSSTTGAVTKIMIVN